MATQRSIELRVGIFVLVCLAVGAGLVWKFGKLATRSQPTYPVPVLFANVGGLIVEANVMYAGVGIGKVREIKLVEDRQLHAMVTLGIYEGVVIRQDAKFVINQAGLLGDRYVDVVPQSATAPPLKPGETVEGSSSVDLTEAIRSVVEVLHQAGGTIERVDKIIRRVDGALQRVDEMVFNTQALSHVALTLQNFDLATSNAVAVTMSLRSVVDDSRGSISNTLGKLALASDNINTVTKHVDDVVLNNQNDIRTAVKNLADSTQKLTTIMDRLEKGEGTAGKFLVDPTLHDELVKLIQNWRRYGLLSKEGDHKRDKEPKSGLTPIPARPAKDWVPPASVPPDSSR